MARSIILFSIFILVLTQPPWRTFSYRLHTEKWGRLFWRSNFLYYILCYRARLEAEVSTWANGPGKFYDTLWFTVAGKI